jgi:hypothetical protein
MPEGAARAYLRDLPDAELHLLDAGHWALETSLDEITGLAATSCPACTVEERKPQAGGQDSDNDSREDDQPYGDLDDVLAWQRGPVAVVGRGLGEPDVAGGSPAWLPPPVTRPVEHTARL